MAILTLPHHIRARTTHDRGQTCFTRCHPDCCYRPVLKCGSRIIDRDREVEGDTKNSAVAAIAVSEKFILLSGVALNCISFLPVAAQEVLPTIEVQRAPQRSGTVRPVESTPAPDAPAQESAYGPVQGYNATRSATGTKTDTPISEIPQSISVVTSDTMRDQGATTVQEALRYVPGVYADAYGPDLRSDGALVRGTTPVTYLDGLRLNNGGYWNHTRPDPFTLSRVEVLRGPGSVLYGDSASNT